MFVSVVRHTVLMLVISLLLYILAIFFLMLPLEDASKETLKPDQMSMSSASDPSSAQDVLVSEAELPFSAPNIEVTVSDSGISDTRITTGDTKKGTSIKKTECDQNIIDKGMETPVVRSRSPSPKPSPKRSPKKGASDSAEGNSVP